MVLFVLHEHETGSLNGTEKHRFGVNGNRVLREE
jgi:hypothetical protein